MSVKRIITTAFFFVFVLSSLRAQRSYPSGYFRNPLDIPVKLAGNFGECRPNHFHTGLDLKTKEQENLKVYAAAEGYVSRISISHSGYGNALYVSHPNGYTTVYAHLNDFYPELQQYLEAQQYAAEKWDLDLEPGPDRFPVKKGAFIAFSGTTGGSTGPHLHFEIRDTRTGHVLNAALFGLPIADQKAPVPLEMALYRPGSIYGQQPLLVSLKKTGDLYSPVKDIDWPGQKIRLAVLANDFMEGSTNSLGVYAMKLYLDNELQASWALDDIDFDRNRYVNAFADYRLKEDKGKWYQTLFRVPGNRLENYTFLNGEDGVLTLDEGTRHEVHIELADANGNTAHVRFGIKTSAAVTPAAGADCTLWKAGQAQQLSTGSFSFRIDAAALYDDICFRYSVQANKRYYSDVLQLHSTSVPLQTYADLGMKLSRVLPFALRSKLVFVHHIKAASLPGNNPQDAAAARYENGWAYARVRTFGNYYVAVDTAAPVIRLLNQGKDFTKAGSIRVSVRDGLTSVASFRAELDGRWLRFVRAGNTYTYIFDGHCPPGRHKLVIKAADENGNTREWQLDFNR